jgi:hypothetical protein
MTHFQLILSNCGGELSRGYAATETEAREVAIQMLRELLFLAHGDTIRVVEVDG